MPKAAVLPLPVLALGITSLPASISGGCGPGWGHFGIAEGDEVLEQGVFKCSAENAVGVMATLLF